MKKLILFFLLFFFVKNSFSQVYDSLVVEGAHWVIEGDDATTPWIDTCYGYKIEGDTVFNSMNYKKVYRLFFKADYTSGAPVWNPPYIIEGKELFAFVREENKKIYAIKFNFDYFTWNCYENQEFLLYDYNLQVGDTITYNNDSISISNLCIDFEYTDFISEIVPPSGNVHRIFKTTAWHHYYEGIGTEIGLFETVGTPVSGGVIPYLTSYCKGTDAFCNLITENTMIKSKSKINIIPNPVINNFQITLPNDHSNATINIMSLQGQVVMQIDNYISQDRIDISLLPSSVYIIKIYTGNCNFKSKLLILKH